VALGYAAFRVWLSVRVVSARRRDDTATEERLALLAFRMRVGFLGLALVVLVVLLVVGLVRG